MTVHLHGQYNTACLSLRFARKQATVLAWRGIGSLTKVVHAEPLLPPLPRNTNRLPSALSKPKAISAHKQSSLHSSSHRVREPRCPVRARAQDQTDDKQDAPGDLYRHGAETESANEARLVRLIYLRSVLEDS